MSDIRNRQLGDSRKHKYQVWWYPTTLPEDEKPQWVLAGGFEYTFQAYDARAQIRAADPQAEVVVTKQIDLDVVETLAR